MGLMYGHSGSFLIVYDVSDKRSIGKVKWLLQKEGFIRIQKSVYFSRYCMNINLISNAIEKLLKNKADTEIRFYRLCKSCSEPIYIFGKLEHTQAEIAIEQGKNVLVY